MKAVHLLDDNRPSDATEGRRLGESECTDYNAPSSAKRLLVVRLTPASAPRLPNFAHDFAALTASADHLRFTPVILTHFPAIATNFP